MLRLLPLFKWLLFCLLCSPVQGADLTVLQYLTNETGDLILLIVGPEMFSYWDGDLSRHSIYLGRKDSPIYQKLVAQKVRGNGIYNGENFYSFALRMPASPTNPGPDRVVSFTFSQGRNDLQGSGILKCQLEGERCLALDTEELKRFQKNMADYQWRDVPERRGRLRLFRAPRSETIWALDEDINHPTAPRARVRQIDYKTGTELAQVLTGPLDGFTSVSVLLADTTRVTLPYSEGSSVTPTVISANQTTRLAPVLEPSADLLARLGYRSDSLQDTAFAAPEIQMAEIGCQFLLKILRPTSRFLLPGWNGEGRLQ